MILKKIKKCIGDMIRDIEFIFSSMIIYFPDGSMGNSLRSWYYRFVLKEKLGADSIIKSGVLIDTRHLREINVEIGDRFIAGPQVTIDPGDSFGIIIGNDVSIAHGAYIRAASHNYSMLDKPIATQGHIAKKILTRDGRPASIIIEDDVMFGAYTIVLSGAKIGRGSVISAGSVVASEIPEYSVVMGNPARVIANRKITPLTGGYEIFP
jgi:maltose O-acetyltransferase